MHVYSNTISLWNLTYRECKPVNTPFLNGWLTEIPQETLILSKNTTEFLGVESTLSCGPLLTPLILMKKLHSNQGPLCSCDCTPCQYSKNGNYLTHAVAHPTWFLRNVKIDLKRQWCWRQQQTSDTMIPISFAHVFFIERPYAAEIPCYTREGFIVWP